MRGKNFFLPSKPIKFKILEIMGHSYFVSVRPTTSIRGKKLVKSGTILPVHQSCGKS